METSVMKLDGRGGLYSPLRDDGRQIRLFRIRPHSNGDMLGYELQTFDVDTAPAYKALSYAWGEPTNAEIFVNNIVKPVRVSLTGLLENMKDMYEPCWLWADQLCINQDDTKERNSQVQLMDRIYRNAEETIIYLGKEPAGIPNGLAFATLDRCLELNHDGDNRAKMSILDRDEVNAVQMLMEAPYWTRHWVLQELILSKNRSIMYGHDGMSWTRFASAIHQLPRDFYAKLHLMPLLSLELLKAMEPRHYDEQLVWRLCMYVASRTRCHDARDKIYGIQSLLPLQQRIAVDYSLPVKEVFINAVVYWATIFPREFLQASAPIKFDDLVHRLSKGMHIRLRDDSDDKLYTFFRNDWETAEDNRTELLRCWLLEHIIESSVTDGENH